MSNLKGVDLLQAQQRQKFIYIDAFSQLFLSFPGVQTTTPTLTLNSRSPWGTQLAQAIVNAVRRVEFDKPALFIEGLDFLLAAAGEEVNTDEILTLVSSLSEVLAPVSPLIRQCTSRIFISVFADDNLLDSSNFTPLAQNQSILLTSLVHRAHSVISLRPLQTGTAKDVTGILRLTRGGAWYDFNTTSARDSDETQEWEMLYRLEDGRAKLFKHA
jgi:elongator complex protein 6